MSGASSTGGPSTSGVCMGPTSIDAGTSECVLTCDGGSALPELWVQDAIPSVSPLNSVVAVDDDFAVAVGMGGAIITWDGGSWSNAISPTTTDLDSVWGDSRSDVWAAGTGIVIHWDGSAWSVQTNDAGTFGSLWGTSQGVWMVTEEGIWDLADGGWAVRAIDGGSGGNLSLFGYSTWGTSPDDLWIANNSQGLLHVQDSSVQVFSTPINASAVWGFSDANLIAAGSEVVGQGGADAPQTGIAEQWTGSWSTFSLPCDGGCESEMGQAWGACPAAVWIPETTFNGVEICRWTGTGCVDEALPNAPSQAYLGSLSGSDHYVWVVGGVISPQRGFIYHAVH
jgi:hypothetical protein